jgi:hypothetical protein
MRVVQESMMPETGPAELAEVFLSGLLLKSADTGPLADPESTSYVFAAGVRDVLQSTLTKGEALSVLDQVGGYLLRGRRGGRPFPVLLQGQSADSDVLAAAEQFPTSFGRISGMLLERIGGPYADAVRELSRPEAARPEEAETEAPARVPRPDGEREGWIHDFTGLSSRKLYQPMLFVGLGGTGCDIGAELERRLRDAICGPDGNDFRRRSGKDALLPYQLPSCIQFVYADMNQADLDRLPRRVVPGPEHVRASALTAHYVTGLVPDIVSYPELALRLRLQAGHIVEGWLPPASRDEPKVNPLHRGAGQFPTIGRASLFGTFIEGIAPAVQGIRQAVGKLATSGEDLNTMGGKPAVSVDVFVAFSVAGGTGAGIFYDYLHIIADTVARSSSMRVKIYPLVLMPSAFQEGLGGGRGAQLNAGRALLDLFRLVDQQNGADAEHILRGVTDRRTVTAEEVAVTYPDNSRLVMRPGTMQTGFLFSQPAGASREDMHRSISSLMLSLIGTEMSEEDRRNGEHHQSFADSFVNEATHRQLPAENGIGGRGVSTALVASLTIPVDELAGIVGSRLLREAVNRIVTVDGKLESTRNSIEEFLVISGVHPVLARHGVEYSDPKPVNGAKQITMALNKRRDSMRIGIDALRTKLGEDVSPMVDRFDPGGATRDMLAKMDIFKLQRVVIGHHALLDDIERGGVRGLLQMRRTVPPPPQQGWDAMPPGSPEMKDGLLRRLQWSDEVPTKARNQQTAWYVWQTKVTWAHAWNIHTPRWTRPLEQVQRDVGDLTRALVDFAGADVEDFAKRSDELYRKRVGVSYMLPSSNGGMEHFYQQVYRRLKEQMAKDGAIEINSNEDIVLRALVGAQAWQDAFRTSVELSPGTAVSYLRERVKTEIKKFLRSSTPGEQPILPRLHDLLIEAAGRGHGTGLTIDPDYVEGFRSKLAGLLPANFTPQGSGQMRVLITYPSDAESQVVENYLKSSVALPKGPRVTEDFRHAQTESISVVLFRTAMGVTEVDEVRDVLRLWAGALGEPRPTDLLRWRQRTGYDFGYLATREHHRVEILHRILSALWNGRATIIGPKASPERINIQLGGGVIMTLPLTPLNTASSWGSLIRAYELWALDDDDMHRAFCAKLMQEVPAGLRGRPERPDELYLVVRDLAEGQVELLDDMMKKQAANQQSRAVQMRSFWADTLPAALDQEFVHVDAPAAATLRELVSSAQGWALSGDEALDELRATPEAAQRSDQSPQRSGTAPEQAFVNLFTRLFAIGPTENDLLLSRLRRQATGTQFGSDVVLECGVTGSPLVRCHVEYKNLSRPVTVADIAAKVLQQKLYQRDAVVDHWILVSPHQDPSNELDLMLNAWEETDEFPFSVQVWSPESGVRELFAIEPAVYEAIYRQPPPDELRAAAGQSVATFKERLAPRLRIGQVWQRYLREPRALCFVNEDIGHLDELYGSHLELRSADERGALLDGSLMDHVVAWMSGDNTSSVLLLLADFGEGKSLFTYCLARRLCEEFLAAPDGQFLPLRIPLRQFREAGSARGLLERRLGEIGATIADWHRLTAQARTLTILDGFDEMSADLSPAAVKTNLRGMESCIAELTGSKILVTSRPQILDGTREWQRILDQLHRPEVLRIAPSSRLERVQYLQQFTADEASARVLAKLRNLYDPIGIAAKPLFLQMIKETLTDLPDDTFSEAILYDTYIRKALSRKIELLEDPTVSLSRDELIANLEDLLEDIAVQLQVANHPYIYLRDYQAPAGLTIAEMLWRMRDQAAPRRSFDASADEDAASRVGIRSLLKAVPAPESDRWPVDFFQRSMQEYFVARAIVRRLRANPDGAQRLLSAAPLPPEITRFAAMLLQERPDQEALAALESIAQSMTDSYVNDNALTLLRAARGDLPTQNPAGS